MVFDYQPTRSGKNPTHFLENFTGTLQTDGYAGYNSLGGKNQKPVKLLACMAHTRRYFEKALDNDKARAEWMLTKMQQLYAIKAEMRKQNFSTSQIQEARQTQAMPILHEMNQWLQDEIIQVPAKSSIGKAIAYTLNLWERLVRYTENGEYLMDNNPIENTIRPVAIGRKNYLFAGSHKAAQNAAMMYSFFGTCKLNRVNPQEWITQTLEKIPQHKANKLQQLLPVKKT